MRRDRAEWASLFGLLAALAILLWGAAIVYHARCLNGRAQALEEQTARVLQSAQVTGIAATLTVEDTYQLREVLEGLEREVQSLRSLTLWLTAPMAHQTVWPWLSAHAVLLHEGLNAAESLSDAAWWVLIEVQSDLETAGQVSTAPGVPVQMHSNVLARGVAAAQRSRAQIVSASESLHHMAAVAASVSWARRWQPALGQLALAVDGLAALAATTAEQPDLVFLLLLQNSDELRATGGFISAVVVLRLDELRLAELSYMNSYDVEAYRQAHPPAPPPLRDHMGAGILLFRDANWSADYSVSAEVLAAIYEMDTGERVDAVLALDAVFLELLLEALGPVPVPEYGVTLTAENVVDTAVGFWERPMGATAIDQRDQAFVDWLTHRKEFGRAVLGQIVLRLQSLDGGESGRFLRAASRAVEERHLQAWVPDNALAQMDLDRMGVSGRVMLSGDASLMVVDSNVGWNKVDRHIERGVDYALTQVDGGWQAEVCLTYRSQVIAELELCEHRSRYEDSYEALTQQCYWNYVRLLVPAQGVLQRAEGLSGRVDQGYEGAQRSYGTLLVVPPGQARTVCLTYFVPAASDSEQRLALAVQAQAGVQRSVSVRVRPRGVYRPVSLPAGWRVDETGAILWSGVIVRDLSAVLRWRVTQ